MAKTDSETVQIELRRTYPVPADELWGRISDFYDLYWLPAVAQTRRLNGRPARVAVLPDGAGEVVEELIDEGQRYHRYRVTDNGPMPVRDFEGLIRVEVVGAESSTVVWRAEFVPAGASASDAEQIVMGVFEGGLERLAELS